MFVKMYRSPDSDNADGTSTTEEVVEAGAAGAATEKKEEKVESRPLTMAEILAQPDLTDALEGDSLDSTTVKTKKEADEDPDKKKTPAPGAKKDDKVKPEKKEEKKDDKKPAAETGGQAGDTGADDQPFEIDVENAEEDVDTSWKGLSKDLLGEETEEDDYETFEKNLHKKLSTVKNEGIEEGKKQAAKLDLEAFNPQARDLITFLSVEGNTIEKFLNPLSAYDEYLALDNKDLVIENYKSLNWEQAEIDNKVKSLEEEGKIDTEAYGIRKQLEASKKNKSQQLIVEAKQKQDQVKQSIKEEKQREDTAVREALSKLGPILGGTLSKKAIDEVANEWDAGVYRERFKRDPAFVAELIVRAKYGASAEKELRKSLTTKTNEKLRKGLSNVDALNSGGAGGRTETTQGKDDDPWQAWEDGFNEKKRPADA